MTRSPSTTGPSVTYFGRATFVGIDDEHELAHLLGADRGVGHEQRFCRRRHRHPDARKHAGGELSIGVGEFGAGADGAGRAFDGVVDEIHVPFVAVVVLIDASGAKSAACAGDDHYKNGFISNDAAQAFVEGYGQIFIDGVQFVRPV